MSEDSGLISRLPPVRGRLRADVELAPITWFRVGGKAEVMFKPADEADLAEFLKNCPADIPIYPIGVASNLIIRDGGIPGVVIRLGGEFAQVTQNKNQITAGAAALDAVVAQHAENAGLAGMEFLSGIPGTIGGALRMNAGAYGSEIKDILIEATAIDRNGKIHKVKAKDLNLTYRHSGAPADWIFTSATLEGTPDEIRNIAARMDDIKTKREAAQPVRARTGGSTFANPDGLKAWALIDAAGCRGLTKGNAQVSELHCNFLLNNGDATAADLEGLGEMVRERVMAHSGIDLRWEIQRIGVAGANQVKTAA